ncbi:MAG: helix-hairpin-helix domain-containing protein, partial [Bacteroidota bacterium]
DNSNIQGSHPVASCVVFKNGKPSKKDYRHFNIKTVVGPDDFASMEEIVYRRYKRLVEEEQSLPQLVIIDGGKGQLSSAMNSIRKLGLENKITVIGIAKKLEEIFFPGSSIPLLINKKSESLKVIQHARNEAHRFAITFHRDKRSQFFTKSSLTDIPGIGEKTAQKLLVHFGSVKKLKAARSSEIQQVTNLNVAKKLKAYWEEEE